MRNCGVAKCDVKGNKTASKLALHSALFGSCGFVLGVNVYSSRHSDELHLGCTYMKPRDTRYIADLVVAGVFLCGTL